VSRRPGAWHTAPVGSPVLSTPAAQLSPRLQRTLEVKLLGGQRPWRSPGVPVGAVLDGQLVWSQHVGAAELDPARPADDDTELMIGSATKTFPALLVMQLRDADRPSLDDPVGTWSPESKHASVTVRQRLAHSARPQREPVGHAWETLNAPDSAGFIEGLERAERVPPPHFVFHYSNLAYGPLAPKTSMMAG